jgi:hypothetical protein
MRCVRLVPLALTLLAVLVLAPARGEEKKPVDPKSLVGKPAPDIELPATQIEKVLPDKKGAKTLKLSDLQGPKGKNVVLFFFPKANTPG